MRKAGVPQAVIMKMTGHKTAAMFHRDNTVDIDDGQEAFRKLEEYQQQERYWQWVTLPPHQKPKKRPPVLPSKKRVAAATLKSLITVVAGPRIELGTRGFSVRCSTG